MTPAVGTSEATNSDGGPEADIVLAARGVAPLQAAVTSPVTAMISAARANGVRPENGFGTDTVSSGPIAGH